MKTVDVIIVGGGPAGLKCAEILGGSSLQVLLLEKNEKIGPKVCAGGLTGKDIAYLNLPDELIEFRYKEVKLHVNSITSRVKSDEEFAFTIDREAFGQWQLRRLKPFDNVEVRTSARVSEITQEYVVANGEKIGYTYLVGADGSNSLVKRFLGLKSKAKGYGIQYIIPTTAYKDFEIFFEPRYFSAWYAWIFPHRDYVSIGTGASHDIMPAHQLKKNFDRWLKEHRMDISNGRYEAFPMDTDYAGYEFGNVFLTGDAASFLSPFTGEGIYQALVSGEEVARKIMNPAYVPTRIPELLAMQNKHKRLITMMIRAKGFRSLIFGLGALLFRIPRFARKAIRVFG